MEIRNTFQQVILLLIASYIISDVCQSVEQLEAECMIAATLDCHRIKLTLLLKTMHDLVDYFGQIM